MKIMIADDHELFRDGLRHVLEQLDGEVDIVEASDYPQALAKAQSDPGISIVLMDLAMPGMPWAEGLQALRQILPATVPVIILSASDDRRHVLQAVNLGAAGFIPKTSSSRVMLSALKLVMSGGVYLPPALLEQANDSNGLDHAMGNGDASFLTPRQREVLVLLGQGKSNKEIAAALNLSPYTIETHRRNLHEKLNLHSLAELILYAVRKGVIS